MKAMLGIAILSLVGLAACTGTDTRSTYAAPAKVDGEGTMRTVQDAQYVAKVERIARIRGVQVHWVHPPVKRVASND